MRKYNITLAALLFSFAVTAQTLNIQTGNITYLMSATQTGEMTYQDGNTLTVMGKTFDLTQISKMQVTQSAVTNNQVTVAYNGSSANVTVAGNIAKYLDIDINGAQVSIVQDDIVEQEISYILSGTSGNGSFYTQGSKKITVVMQSLNLTCSDSAAVNIHNGKRIALQIEGSNTLTDGKNGSQKACLVIKGHPEITGSGTLTLIGNSAHGIKTNEYMQLKSDFTGSVIVKSAAKDGIHIGQYLEMNNGTLTVESCSDDGIQIEKTSDTTDEMNGQVIIKGGKINVNVAANAGKGLKSDSLMTISGGVFNITTTGGGVTGTNDTTSACACIKSGYDMLVLGGTFTLKSTGQGGKGISVDGNLTITDGNFSITTTGTRYSSSSSGGGGWWAPKKMPQTATAGPGGGGGWGRKRLVFILQTLIT